MPAEKHIHSYVRVDGTKNKFMCQHATCTHYTDKKFLVGKLSLCPECRTEEFVLTRDMLKRAIPKCLNCRNTAEAQSLRKAKALLENILPDENENTVGEGI